MLENFYWTVKRYGDTNKIRENVLYIRLVPRPTSKKYACAYPIAKKKDKVRWRSIKIAALIAAGSTSEIKRAFAEIFTSIARYRSPGSNERDSDDTEHNALVPGEGGSKIIRARSRRSVAYIRGSRRWRDFPERKKGMYDDTLPRLHSADEPSRSQ